MATNVVMPRISDTMKEGMVVKWLKAEGEPVAKGEPLVEIQSDKATLEIEAYASGVLRLVIAHEEEIVPLGETIAVIAGADEDISGLLPDTPADCTPSPADTLVASPAPTPKPSSRTKASPVARKMAEERGIDLATVTGTGPDGRIVKRDMLAYQPPRPARPAPTQARAEDEEVRLTPMRKAIAERMAQSKAAAPHFYITVEVDMGRAIEMRRQVNEQCGDRVHLTINDLVVKAVALALRQCPEVNSSFAGDRVIRRGGVHVGIAVDVPGGLVVPVVCDCDQKSLAQISAESKALVQRARDGKLAEDEYTGGTFTVSNMGMYNVENFAAIINPPEAALLAVASVRRVPAVVGDAVAPADRMKMTLSGDHRVLSGAVAVKFLDEVRRLLESPMGLVV